MQSRIRGLKVEVARRDSVDRPLNGEDVRVMGYGFLVEAPGTIRTRCPLFCLVCDSVKTEPGVVGNDPL